MRGNSRISRIIGNMRDNKCCLGFFFFFPGRKKTEGIFFLTPGWNCLDNQKVCFSRIEEVLTSFYATELKGLEKSLTKNTFQTSPSPQCLKFLYSRFLWSWVKIPGYFVNWFSGRAHVFQNAPTFHQINLASYISVCLKESGHKSRALVGRRPPEDLWRWEDQPRRLSEKGRDTGRKQELGDKRFPWELCWRSSFGGLSSGR